ncbi:hypothetical protein BOSE21B_80114 [Bosea sp. 21B]|nr:hypothetical protein BOSE21B_80114 [Bosea sp. 21B]
MKALEIVGTDAEIVGDLRHGETPQRLLGVGRKFLQTKLIQLARYLCALLENFIVKLERSESVHISDARPNSANSASFADLAPVCPILSLAQQK